MIDKEEHPIKITSHFTQLDTHPAAYILLSIAIITHMMLMTDCHYHPHDVDDDAGDAGADHNGRVDVIVGVKQPVHGHVHQDGRDDPDEEHRDQRPDHL